MRRLVASHPPLLQPKAVFAILLVAAKPEVGATFEEIAREWLSSRQLAWVLKYATPVRCLEGDVFPAVGDHDIRDITPGLRSLASTIFERKRPVRVRLGRNAACAPAAGEPALALKQRIAQLDD